MRLGLDNGQLRNLAVFELQLKELDRFCIVRYGFPGDLHLSVKAAQLDVGLGYGSDQGQDNP